MDLVYLVLTCHIANPSAKFNRAEYLNTFKPGFSGNNAIYYILETLIKFLMFRASKFLTINSPFERSESEEACQKNKIRFDCK